MKYKAIICDFDGTLVGPERIMSDSVKEAIRTLSKLSFPFSIATGRLFHGFIENACEELMLFAPQITKAGAEIVDPQNNKVLIGEYIPDTIADDVIDYLKTNNAIFHVEKGDTAYTLDGKRIIPVGPIQFKKIGDLVIKDIPKINIGSMGDSKQERILEERLIKQYPQLHITKAHSPSGKSWDITAPLANKHVAVLRVAKLLNIYPQEIIGIGDGYNDFPLLEACGLKVAMGNAVSELKEIADYIAPSVEEDGVADVIKKFIIENN